MACDLLNVSLTCIWHGGEGWAGGPAAPGLQADLPAPPSFYPDGEAVTVVRDAREDAALCGSPWVTSAPHLRFLAALAPQTAGGALVMIGDLGPRDLTPDDLRRLRDIAAMADQTLRLADQARHATLREREFRILAETSTDTIVRGNMEGVRLYISPSVRALLGYEPEELIGRRASDIVHPDDAVPFGALIGQIRAGTLDVGLIEVRQRHKDGRWVWMEASVRLTYEPLTGVPDGYVASVRDIQRRKQAEDHLTFLASHDALTGLANRSTFDRKLADALDRFQVDGQPVALLCLDVDRFKRINDTYGHQAGDALLRTVADRLRAAIGDAETAARLGGDEFALILLLRDHDEAASLRLLATQLIDAMAEPIHFGGQAIAAGLSIGIALSPRDGTDAHTLLSSADAALYAAKNSGRNMYRFAAGALDIA